MPAAANRKCAEGGCFNTCSQRVPFSWSLWATACTLQDVSWHRMDHTAHVAMSHIKWRNVA